MTTMSITTTTQTATATAALAASRTAATTTPESIQQSLQKAMKHTGLPRGGGSPGGGSSGEGGRPSGGAPTQIPIPAAQDVCTAGHSPAIFKGDRTIVKLNNFWIKSRDIYPLITKLLDSTPPSEKSASLSVTSKDPK